MYTNLSALRLVFALFLILSTFSSCDDDDDLQYVLMVSKSVEEGGSVSPSRGTYLPGEVARITVTPSESYTFKEWQGDASGQENPILITMNSNKSITAVFEKKEME
ncbi:InlB B-repeat-containing protein [Lutimonas sp.]|uniref:InlB B-repeat-containing protein n=1 Tax=Lutimonas sp. TaxID=1872403 RepID=UPI003D9AC5FD